MKIKIISSLIFFISLLNCYSQEREIIDSTFIPMSKWPFLGPEIPKHIGFTFGIEGFDNKTLMFGVFHNITNLSATGDAAYIGGRWGYNLYFKKYINNNNIYSVEFDYGLFAIIALGLNINYNHLDLNNFFGFKPFIGFSVFHFDFLYGYSFYKKSNDPNNLITPHRITIRINVPILKLTKKKEVKHYIYTYPDF